MKKIIALVLVLSLAAFSFVACKKDKDDTNTEKTYSVAIVVDSTVSTSNKVSNTALVLVTDADGKIVAARFDAAETTPALNEDGTVKAVSSVKTKVEQGDSYTGMPAGSWAKQTKAFEDLIVGKTAAEVAALDTSNVSSANPIVAGCTMSNTVPAFQKLVAKAFASTLKVTFKTSEAITVGVAISTAVSASRSGGASVTSDMAGTVVAGGKVVACVLDSVEQTFSVTDGALTAGELAVSKNDQGDSYTMPAGSWAKQAQAFANSAVGKTVADLANLETVSDALAAAGCTMKNTTAGYKTTIIAAAGYAR